MITEAQIEATILQMESDDFEDNFAQSQDVLWNYLNSDGFSGLTSEEQQMMFFVHSTIYHTCSNNTKDFEEFDIELFQQHEDQNWALRESTSNFKEALDQYFEAYEEEDLLAFVEDMLVGDEDTEISELGKEVIFITTKSYIDFLTDSE